MADILMVIKNLHSMHSHFLNLGSLPLTTAPTDNNRNFSLTLQLLCLSWQTEMKEMESNLSPWRSSYSRQLLTLIDQRLSFYRVHLCAERNTLCSFLFFFSHLTSVLLRWILFSFFFFKSISCVWCCWSAGSFAFNLHINKLATYCIFHLTCLADINEKNICILWCVQ